MTPFNPYARYQQTSVETATPTRLVVMLFDGAIRFLQQAQPAMQARQLDVQSRQIGKAQAILAHLRGTLDFERGGEVAHALDTCYLSCYQCLNEANIYDRADRLQQAIDALRELREAWTEVDRQCQAHKAVAPAERVAA